MAQRPGLPLHLVILLAAPLLLLAGCQNPFRPAAATPQARPAPPTERPVSPGTWQRAGLAGMDVHALAGDARQPGALYAGGSGLWVSRDAGKTWASLHAGMIVTDIAVSAADPRVIYAGATDGCARGTEAPSFRSADGGKSWTGIGGNLASYAPHPAGRDVVYAASCPDAVRSRDGGQTWERLVGARQPNYDAWRVAVAPSAPDVIYVMSVSEGGTVRLARSSDAGVSWHDVTPAGDVWGPVDLQVHPQNPDTVYAVTWAGAFRTSDGGASWQAASEGLQAARQMQGPVAVYLLSSLAIDPAHPETLYLATGGSGSAGRGVFWSRDGGRHWERLGDGLGTRPVRDVIVAAGAVFAATSDGVWQWRSE